MREKVKKVPVILQMEAVECGAASLAMVCAYHKKYIPLEEMRTTCSVSRDGSNAKNIAKAAIYYGLKTRAFKCEPQGLKTLKLPAIIHWNFNHFVVLCGFKKNCAVINDPAGGRVEISYDELNSSFTGIVLDFEPGEAFEPGGSKKSIVSFLAKRLENSKGAVAYISILGFLAGACGLAAPIFSRIFTDYILFGKSVEIFAPLILAMLGAVAVTFLVTAMQGYFLTKLRGKLSLTSGSLFFSHILSLPIEFFSHRYVGDMSERQESNDEVAEIVCDRLTPVFLSIIMIVLYFIMLMAYDTLMAVVGLGVAIANIAITTYVANTTYSQSRIMLRDFGKLSAMTVSGIEMMETIKASGAEAGYFENWAGYLAKATNASGEVKTKFLYYNLIPDILQVLLNVFVIVMGVYNILDGRFTVGMLLAFQGFMSAFLQPAKNLADLGDGIQSAKGKMERIDDVLNYPTVEEHIETEDYTPLSGDIVVDNISFGYSPLAQPLIKDLSLHIKKGQSVAIVGGSGSGKSTLAKLICGLHTVQKGEILFDGKRKSLFNSKVFTNSLTIVDQSATIFNDTIKNNIAMWDTLIPDIDIIEAAKDAQIHDEIMKREKGYENVILEGGRNLSGGQKQRIDIARSLVLNPTIVILDEATSALDPITEKRVMDSIKKRGATMIIIAHRLSAIRDADLIVFLEEGVICEQGTHSELIEINGKYARLVSQD